MVALVNAPLGLTHALTASKVGIEYPFLFGLGPDTLRVLHTPYYLQGSSVPT